MTPSGLFLNGAIHLNHKLKRAAIKLVKWTGKSREYLHPKHLIAENNEQAWFLGHCQSNDYLLDVGCGLGATSLAAAERCLQVDGFDTCAENIAAAKRLAQARGIANVQFQTGNAEGVFPYADALFDVVLMQDILEHLVNRRGALREAHRILKPTGRLLLVVPNRETTLRRRLAQAGIFSYSDPDHKIEYTRAELETELAQGGFRIAGPVEPVVYDTLWVGLIDLIGGFSLSLYSRLSLWKKEYARRHPEESTGFCVVCAKRTSGP